MFGNLDTAEIEEVLSSQIVGRIGCHADGKTYIVPVSYAYDGEYIFGHTYEGMKISMMRANPQICFEVDDMKNMANWRSVIAWGNFDEPANEGERNTAVKKLLGRITPMIASDTVKISPQWPFPPEDPASIKGIVYRIKLHTKTGRFERS